jgi:hypothetical protein
MNITESQHEVITSLILEKQKLERERDEAREVLREIAEAREVLREIAEASGFDNIGNRARNKARKEIDRYREKNDLLPISWDV